MRQEITFSSLKGSDKIKLLRQLPGKMSDLLQEETQTEVLQLWSTLLFLLEVFSTDKTGKEVQREANLMLDTFVRLGSRRKGYGKERLTPYIHILCHHAPQKHKEQMCLGKFCSQALEKKNDILKHFYHLRSNKWDSATDPLNLSKLLEADTEVRQRRAYKKTDQEDDAAQKDPAPGTSTFLLLKGRQVGSTIVATFSLGNLCLCAKSVTLHCRCSGHTEYFHLSFTSGCGVFSIGLAKGTFW